LHDLVLQRVGIGRKGAGDFSHGIIAQCGENAQGGGGATGYGLAHHDIVADLGEVPSGEHGAVIALLGVLDRPARPYVLTRCTVHVEVRDVGADLQSTVDHEYGHGREFDGRHGHDAGSGDPIGSYWHTVHAFALTKEQQLHVRSRSEVTCLGVGPCG